MSSKFFYPLIYCKSWWICSNFKKYTTWFSEIYGVKISTIYNRGCVQTSFDYSVAQGFLLFISRCTPCYMMYCSDTYHPILCIWQAKYIYNIRSMIVFLVIVPTIIIFSCANLVMKAASILTYELES